MGYCNTLKTILLRRRLAVCAVLCLGLITPSPASAAYTVTPATWNVIGLDSNRPASGPYRFPVGAKVCSTTAVTNVPVALNWHSANPYVDLRTGSLNPITIPAIAAGSCADAYFEVEVARNALAFNTTRSYSITTGGASTPTPRELFVEYLISQSRNAVNDIRLDGVSVPAGGSMNLIVGNTYTIELHGGTATQGYNQFESFVNFSNTIFQILSVSSTYSANTSPYVPAPNPKLYADACGWENDPNSPNYLDCVGGDFKTGGTNTVTTYVVKIIGGGGSSETLNSLLYDFSGSSFHYNADYSVGARYANIIDPTNINIAKTFSPNPTNVNGVSTLTFTLTNPNAGAVSNVSFTDTFPIAPGAMTVATPPSSSNSCGGALSNNLGGALAAGVAGIRLTGATIPASGSCTIKLNVTAPTVGSYVNTTENLFVGAIDTGRSASDTLTVNTTPPPPAPPSSCPGSEVELARWTMAPAQGTTTPPLYFSKAADVATATASFTGGTNSISTTDGSLVNSWSGAGWATAFPETATPYYEFVIDTSKYGGVTINSDYYIGSGTWAAPANNFMIIDSKDDAGSYVNIRNANIPKGSWQSIGGPFAAATTGTSTTSFKIRAYGAKTLADPIFLDNIVFLGCKIPSPPTLAKVFSPNPVAAGATTTLTFTVVNPNGGSALSGIAFTDTLPANLTVTNGSSAQCGGTLTRTAPNSLSFAGGTLAVSGSCTITAIVTATTAGPHENVSGFVSATETGPNIGSSGVATATLTALAPPSIVKRFAPDPILANGLSTLTFDITNPNQNNALAGVAFADTFPLAPGTMVVANPTGASTSGCGAPVFAPGVGAGAVAFSSGAIAAGGTCTATVNITAPTTGTYTNTSGNVSYAINAATVNGNATTASLDVNAPSPGIALLKQAGRTITGPWKSFLAVPPGGNVYYKFTIENIGDVPLNTVSLSDPDLNTASCVWPASLPVADALDDDHIATCVVGPISAVDGEHPNTATASATYGVTPYSDSSTARYATTVLSVEKTASQSYFLTAGETLNYSFVVENIGAAALLGPVTIADDKASDESCPAVSSIGDGDNFFDPGETITCTATYTTLAADVTARQITNKATATVDGVNSLEVSLTVPRGPDLVVVKTNNVGGGVDPGDTFEWTLTVSNDATTAGPAATTEPVATFGSTARFTNGQVLLVDDLPDTGETYSIPATATNADGTTGIIDCAIVADTLTCTANGPVYLPVGGSFSVKISVTTTVVRTLVNPKGGGSCQADPGTLVVEVDDSNNACADTVEVAVNPLTLVKSSPQTFFSAAGDVLTYSYLITNVGALPLAGPATVADDKVAAVTCPALTTVGNNDANLDPGEAVTCTSDAPHYVVVAADVTAAEVTNTATATVGAITSRQAVLTIPLSSGTPNLLFLKSFQTYSDPVNNTTGPVPIPGALVDYTLLITNTGAGAVDNNTLVITDPIPTNTRLFVGDLGQGGPVLFSDADADSGFTGPPPLPFTLDYSSDADCSTYGYVPVADADGFDTNVCRLRIGMSGSMSGAVVPDSTEFSLTFRVRVE